MKAPTGRTYLVIHGDQFDGVIKHAKWLAFIGDRAYTTALSLNHWYNVLRIRAGKPYWSLSRYLKHKVKNAVAYIANFEQAMAEVARQRGVDGIICGHIHHPEIRDIDGVLYCNDGDWVESCSALVEHFDGRLEILHWADLRGLSPLEAQGRARATASPPVTLPDGADTPVAPVPQPPGRQEPAPAHAESGLQCASSSSPTPGRLRSMVSFVPFSR